MRVVGSLPQQVSYDRTYTASWQCLICVLMGLVLARERKKKGPLKVPPVFDTVPLRPRNTAGACPVLAAPGGLLLSTEVLYVRPSWNRCRPDKIALRTNLRMTACDNPVSTTSVVVSMIILVRTSISAAATWTRFDQYPDTSNVDQKHASSMLVLY